MAEEDREALAEAIIRHPAWGGFFLGPCPDHTPPDLRAGRLHGTGPADAAALAALGIRVEGGGEGGANRILAAPGTGGHDLLVRFGRSRGCTLVLGAEGRLAGQVGFEGDGHLMLFNGRGASQVNATFRNREGALFLGRGFTANLVDLLVEGPRNSIVVADDAMLAYRVQLRTSDSHGIVSLDDPSAALNPPASIRLGPHVWLGKDVVVGRGVTVGRGAIVAMNTIVTAHVPPCTLVGGVPMRVLREGVTWTRASQPAPPEIRAAIAFARGGPES